MSVTHKGTWDDSVMECTWVHLLKYCIQIAAILRYLYYTWIFIQFLPLYSSTPQQFGGKCCAFPHFYFSYFADYMMHHSQWRSIGLKIKKRFHNRKHSEYRADKITIIITTNIVLYIYLMTLVTSYFAASEPNLMNP